MSSYCIELTNVCINLEDPGNVRGFPINTFVIHLVADSYPDYDFGRNITCLKNSTTLEELKDSIIC